MIDVYLVWFIYIYYFYFAKKSLSKNKLQTIPHLESGFDVVHCASEIKPDCSVMSAIVFQTCSYDGYSVITHIIKNLMAVVHICTSNQVHNWEWKCRKHNLQPWSTEFHFAQPLHVSKLDLQIEYCSDNWPSSYSTLRTQPSEYLENINCLV